MRQRRTVELTSAEAYDEIKRTGRLAATQFQVYDFLHRRGPSTAGEIDHALANPHKSGVAAASYHKRVSELERKGVVERDGVRKCRVTGRNAIVWKTTAKLPSKLPPRERTEALTRDDRESVAFFLRAWLPESPPVGFKESDIKKIRKLVEKIAP